MSSKYFMFEQYQVLHFENKIYLQKIIIFHYNIITIFIVLKIIKHTF